METMDRPYSKFERSYRELDMVRATRSISRRSHPHSLSDAIVISPSSTTSCLSASHLATSRISWPSYVDYSSTHAAGMNLVSAGCHFPTSQLRTNRASFETSSASLNTKMRLLATNSFLGCRRFLGVLDCAEE